MTLINLTEQRLFQYSDNADDNYTAVVITRGARLYGLNETTDNLELWHSVDDDRVTEVAGTPDKVYDETTNPPISKAAPAVSANAPDALEVVERGSLADAGVVSAATIAKNSDLVYVGTDQGLTELHIEQINATTSWQGWSKFTTITRQTPLMPNTVKAMIPMDDASGTNITDAAESNIFVAKNTPTLLADGVRGKAIAFNGTDEYLCADGVTDDETCEVDATLTSPHLVIRFPCGSNTARLSPLPPRM